MSTHKKIDTICVVVMVCALILTILFMNGEKLGLIPIVDEDALHAASSEYFTENDLNGSWDTSSATVITLDNDTASISGNGAYVLDGNVVIAGAGHYILEGTLSDGSIIIDAHNTSKVWILLNGVNICCS
ncbi:MAG: carbohydrate-binding domain-containing protein, partial [Oscillospiraceae bacterium]|nr:carbohydrate-binding domain-containing protein [Oscillospiraceae bacterium]